MLKNVSMIFYSNVDCMDHVVVIKIVIIASTLMPKVIANGFGWGNEALIYRRLDDSCGSQYMNNAYQPSFYSE